MIRRRTAALPLAVLLALPLSAAAMPDPAPGLTVRVENVADDQGEVRIAVFTDAERFATEGGATYRAAVPAREGMVEAAFPDLKPGTYAITLYHDADGNGALTRFFGALPTEGWGASNNPGSMTRPTWENANFTLPESGSTVTVRLNY